LCLIHSIGTVRRYQTVPSVPCKNLDGSEIAEVGASLYLAGNLSPR